MTYASTFIGLAGEYIIAQELHQREWSTAWLGGRTKDRDLVATSPSGTAILDISVKTTTAHDGKIHWAKPGRKNVDPWIQVAQREGREPVIVLLHADPTSVDVQADLERGGFFVPMPQINLMSAFKAKDWGDFVDRARSKHGQRRRLRGSGAEYLEPKNLFYPACVEDGEPLDDFLQRFP